ncbi:GNAT family N-acetyltransferase [Arthrobacter sp. NPDC056691]|uniref:GNAT family N-acetyltransferase n=1 Tax=Arthrobacter sp. NPDC056691 TaxID=3345913 RepID=UPI00366E6599
MTSFSRTVNEFWRTPFDNGDVLSDDDSFRLIINPRLSHERRVTVLRTNEGKVMAALTPALAYKLDLHQRRPLSEPAFRLALKVGAIRLHSPDCLFYYPDPSKADLLRQDAGGVRHLLRGRDGALFEEFQSAAPERDLAEAYVELDHWAVFGCLDHGQLVSAASMYPWEGAHIADIGILTLPAFRGNGHAKRVVRAISAYAFDQGYEPQYRCQRENHASKTLAASAGLEIFGEWEVIAPSGFD